MKLAEGANENLLVDISDALSERDRVRFTVHTRTKLPHFAKPVLSVVRQHEDFIWLHDCLEDNDQYAGYIIPPAPPKPDFDSSREKLQRLGDGESNMTKDEFAKMKQELEAEYLAIFKKTVAMHEMFLQRLAAHEKFRDDNNFKIFLEYESELAVRCKSKKERIADSIQNIGKSLTDFVITTSQVAATTSAGTSLLTGQGLASSSSSSRQLVVNKQPTDQQKHLMNNGNNNNNNTNQRSDKHGEEERNSFANVYSTSGLATSVGGVSRQQQQEKDLSTVTSTTGDGNNNQRENNNNQDDQNDQDVIDEQYFEKERLFLALYYNSIRETAIQADKVVLLQKCVADSYLHIAQQLIKLASIEVIPITAQTKDSSRFVSCPLPSLTMPTTNTITNNHQLSVYNNNNDQHQIATTSGNNNLINNPLASTSSSSSGINLMTSKQPLNNHQLSDDDDEGIDTFDSSSKRINSNSFNDIKQGDTNSLAVVNNRSGNKHKQGCANNQTSEGLKELLLHVSDYFEQARKVETRIASDEDLKLTDTFLYYKRDTVAAQDLLMRRLRFMAEYETATRNLEKARQKGRTQMQYADVIQKQAKENFLSISKLAKQELIDYKQRRVASFRKAFSDLVELELKHLRSHSNLIMNCLNTCRGLTIADSSSNIHNNGTSSSSETKREPGAQLTASPSKSTW